MLRTFTLLLLRVKIWNPFVIVWEFMRIMMNVEENKEERKLYRIDFFFLSYVSFIFSFYQWLLLGELYHQYLELVLLY